MIAGFPPVPGANLDCGDMQPTGPVALLTGHLALTFAVFVGVYVSTKLSRALARRTAS